MLNENRFILVRNRLDLLPVEILLLIKDILDSDEKFHKQIIVRKKTRIYIRSGFSCNNVTRVSFF